MRAVRVALLLGVLAVVGGVVLAASADGPRLVGSNHYIAPSFVVTLAKERRVCQSEVLPAGTGSIQVTVGTYGRPRPAVRLRADGVTGYAPPGAQGATAIRLRRPLRHEVVAPVCLTFSGRSPVVLAGDASIPTPAVAGSPVHAAIRLEYLTARPESWWSTLGPSIRRFGHGKASWQGSWTFVLVMALALAALATAVWALVRQPS